MGGAGEYQIKDFWVRSKGELRPFFLKLFANNLERLQNCIFATPILGRFIKVYSIP